MPKKTSEEFNNIGNSKNPANSNRTDIFYNFKAKDQTTSNNSAQAPKGGTNKKPQHKAQDLSAMAKTATVVLATLTAASIGMSGVVDILPPQEKAYIEIYAEEDYVSYYVELEGYKDGQVYTVTIHNDFTNRKQEFSDSGIQGYEEGLKPNMYYTFSVKNGNKLIAQKRFVTESRRQKSDGYDPDELYTSDGEENPIIQDDYPEVEPDNPTTGRN